jgi:quercetin dioxygenase-like cupin family protein
MEDRAVNPFAHAPGGGLAVENPVGGVLTFKAMSAETGGVVTAIETVAAAGEGPPLHVHHESDETIHTLSGQFRIKVGDRLIDAAPGSFVFIPRGTPHTWQNAGDTPARFLAAVMPADPRFEEFFVRYAPLPAHERGQETFARLAVQTRAFDVLGPPLDEAP